MNQNISANIIVIDDEIDLCELLEYNLNRAGFNVTTFLDTKRVEQFLDEEDTDLFIVDRNLNGRLSGCPGLGMKSDFYIQKQFLSI